MYTDTHAHLNDPRFKNTDEVMNTALSAGVSLIINAGYDLKSTRRGAELAGMYKELFFAAGIHPSEAGRFDINSLSLLEPYLKQDKCVALGEIGLDYHYDGFSKEKQTALFMAQLELARALDLPVIIHSRDCTQDLIKIIDDNPNYFKRCVMHCFSGSSETAQILVKKGIFVSFAGTVTFKNARNLALAAKSVPLDFILTETDCPYLAPEPHRGKTNQMAYVCCVADYIADLRGIDVRFLNRAVRRNTLKLFDKIKGDFEL